MARYRSSNPIMDEIFRIADESERRKPRIECPRHGNTLICATCRKCLSCIWDEGIEWQLKWCNEQRHTFLNLFAPCKFCRGRGGIGSIDTPEASKCTPCWEKDYAAYHKKMREQARQRSYTPTYYTPTSESTSSDDYYPDYEGEDLEDADD